MLKLFWLSIFCLTAIGSLVAARTFAGMTTVSRTAPEEIAADVTDITEPPLAKGDRLPTRLLEKAPPKSTMKIEKIAPIEVPQQTEAKNDIVSWHWHEGSKVVRRRSQ
jgi:hypothetical protein